MDLSKISSIFVIARNSTFTYKDRPVKIKKVAEDLGVQGEQELFARKYTDNIEAYDAFLEGMKYLYLMNSESLGEAVSFFKRRLK
jgi:negative regulator of replication initiation